MQRRDGQHAGTGDGDPADLSPCFVFHGLVSVALGGAAMQGSRHPVRGKRRALPRPAELGEVRGVEPGPAFAMRCQVRSCPRSATE